MTNLLSQAKNTQGVENNFIGEGDTKQLLTKDYGNFSLEILDEQVAVQDITTSATGFFLDSATKGVLDTDTLGPSEADFTPDTLPVFNPDGGQWMHNGTLTDVTLRGNDGTGTNITYTTGHIGATTATFNGTDSKVDLTSDIVTGFEFTVLGWFNLSDIDDFRGIISNDTSKTEGAIAFFNKKTINFFSASPSNYVTMSKFMPENEWFHLAIIGTDTNKVKIYLNSELVAEDTINAGTYNFRRIGNVPDDNFNYPKAQLGKIEDFRIYEAPLSVKQIEIIYNEGLGTYNIYPVSTDEEELDSHFRVDDRAWNFGENLIQQDLNGTITSIVNIVEKGY